MGNLEITEMILARGGGNRHYEVNEALVSAVQRGDLPIIETLLKRGGADFANVSAHPLTTAVARNNLVVLNMLLPHVSTSQELAHALVVAAQFGFVEGVEALLEHGAHVNALESGTPLRAVRWGTVEVVRLLLERGADVDVCGRIDKLVQEAQRSDNHEAVTQLLMEHIGRLRGEGFVVDLRASLFPGGSDNTRPVKLSDRVKQILTFSK
ncbi:ankyrin [Gonapodya prolifera JEL478]|uniref:Ankyrin n=1 Tax=Gonapodya prolifera (strain JEL478) TaxID=1344416 RepID=A0A139AFH9_GONPJ|nr:ankyrin [Gonapodya prolifera JEL478]|eukprot:KXS15510.1 ankyrin [Gonapodya prolifera JEL478]